MSSLFLLGMFPFGSGWGIPKMPLILYAVVPRSAAAAAAWWADVWWGTPTDGACVMTETLAPPWGILLLLLDCCEVCCWWWTCFAFSAALFLTILKQAGKDINHVLAHISKVLAFSRRGWQRNPIFFPRLRKESRRRSKSKLTLGMVQLSGIKDERKRVSSFLSKHKEVLEKLFWEKLV